MSHTKGVSRWIIPRIEAMIRQVWSKALGVWNTVCLKSGSKIDDTPHGVDVSKRKGGGGTFSRALCEVATANLRDATTPLATWYIDHP